MLAAKHRDRRPATVLTVLLLGLLAGCVGAPRPPAAPQAEAAQCLSQLAARGVRFEAVAAPVATNGCGIDNAVRLQQSSVAWNRPAEMGCLLATRLESFEREAVQPAAQRYFGKPVAVIHHLGAYACRGENGGHTRLSQHALGKAIDIGGFELGDGTRISVESDWRARGPRREFLREIAKRACAYFNVVLTPASDAIHHNHFHFDVGPYRLCSVG